MLINEDEFRAIEARWRAAFQQPYEGRAEFWDYGMRVALAVFRDGEKVFEQKDNLGAPLRRDGSIEALAVDVKRRLPPLPPTES